MYFDSFYLSSFGKQNLINLSQFSRFIVIFFISSYQFIFLYFLFVSILQQLEEIGSANSSIRTLAQDQK